MARITIEDCLDKIDNHFDLVLVATRRARQLLNQAEPTLEGQKHKVTVNALREIAEGRVGIEILDEPVPERSQDEVEKTLASLFAETDTAAETKLGSAAVAAEESAGIFNKGVDNVPVAQDAVAIPEPKEKPPSNEQKEEQELLVSLERLQDEESIDDEPLKVIDDTQTEIQEMTVEDMEKMSDLGLDKVADETAADEEEKQR